MKYYYDISGDMSLFNTFQIWKAKEGFPDDLNDDLDQDDQIVTDFIEMQRKANKHGKLVEWAKWAYDELSEAWDEEMPKEFTNLLDTVDKA